MKKLIGLMLVLGAGAINAAPVTWVFDSVTLNDGGTVTGSFVYDAALNEYSAIDVLTTAGSSLPGNHYSLLLDPAPYIIAANVAFFHQSDAADKTGLPVLALFLNGYLTDAGGSVQIFNLVETFCGDAACVNGSGPSRFQLSGSVTAVPVPAAVWLFGSGLGLLGWMRHKKA